MREVACGKDVGPEERREGVIGAEIAVHDEKGSRAEHRQGLVYAAARLERSAALIRVRDRDAEATPIAERLAYLRAEPGQTIQRHRHTGEIFAFTLAGSWKYLEYPEVNVAGSFLYEPAGSVHTLHFPETNTETTDVWFVLHGANLNLDAEDNVESVLDASAALAVYRAACRESGLPEPDVIGA